MKKRSQFSIIVPFYQNQLNVPHTVPALFDLVEKLKDYDIEFLFVEDGSRDETYKELLSRVKESDLKVRLIKLSRNFGQIAAIRAGLFYATGDCAGIISADLQDPPGLFVQMLEKWEQGFKLVIAERSEREEGLMQRFFSSMYWKLVRRFALPSYPIGGFDFCIIDRVIIDNIINLSERNTQIFPLIFSLGYSNTILPYKREKRKLGKSQWTFAMKLKLFIDTFIAFSYLPIRSISVIGLVIALLSISYAAAMAFMYFIYGNQFTGWTTIVVLLSTIGGLILITLGIIGEYVWRILDQVRKRPLFLVEDIFDAKT